MTITTPLPLHKQELSDLGYIAGGFPSLSSNDGLLNCEPWFNLGRFLESVDVSDKQERHAAAFILALIDDRLVEKCRYGKGPLQGWAAGMVTRIGEFRLMAAVCEWDEEHLRAWKAWAAAPFICTVIR